jgi:hypothetical protein
MKEEKMQGNALCAVHVLYGGELKRIMNSIEGARTSMAVAGGMIVVTREVIPILSRSRHCMPDESIP